MSRFIVSYNNAFRILHNLHMRCSASFMFANAVFDSCSTCIRKSIFSLMSRLNTSTNIIVQSTLNSDVYTGKYQVNIETLKAGDETIAKQLAKLYTKCITERRIPKTWKEANMVIFFKKGNRKDIKSYRPICLLSNMYKLFTKIITTRLEKKLDENQPREQAGFRSKYSTTDHIHAINQLKEKCREYNIPLCVAFVDYEKAFDSVQTQPILTSLQEQGIEDVYIELLKDIYTDSSVTVHLHKESEKIRIKR